MVTLFKSADNIENPSVGDMGFLSHYPDVNTNTAWVEILPFVEDAIRQNIAPYMGDELLTDIADKIENHIILNTSQIVFVELLRRATAYYAACLFIPSKHTTTASAGEMQNNSNQASPASLSSLKFKLWQVTLQADKHMDILLEFMEKQVFINNTYFDLWKESTAYKKGTSPFFRHTTAFNYYYNIFESRRTFLALIPHINDVCEDIITPVICNDLFLEIKEQLESDSLSDANSTLLHHIRKTVAYLAVAKAAPYLSIVVESDGFKIVSSTEGMDKRDSAMNQHQARIDKLVNHALDEGTKNLNRLKKYIADNAQLYTLYINSPCYTAANARRAGGIGVNVIGDCGSTYIYRKR
jgi:hypothetical protein